MTRDYNNQRRDDLRPPFRHKSSTGRYGEEQSSRPGRPRLSRETVDRAWEQGAQQRHADYRPRGNNGPGPRNNRYTQPPAHSSYQNGNGGKRPYGNRPKPHNSNSRDYQQGNYRRNEPDSQPYPSSRQRDYDANRRNFDDQRYPDSQRNWNKQGNGVEPRKRSPRDYYNRENTSPNRYNGQGNRTPQGERQWNRPWSPNNRNASGKQYEGDYEHFDSYSPPTNRAHRHSHNYDRPQPPREEERYVTRMPDGRVLKGSRPSQRKNARFWMEIAEDTEMLVGEVTPDVAEKPFNTQQANGEERETTPQKKKSSTPRKARTADPSRGSKKAKAPQAHTSGPKPSQRGFKWPSP